MPCYGRGVGERRTAEEGRKHQHYEEEEEEGEEEMKRGAAATTIDRRTAADLVGEAERRVSICVVRWSVD